MNPKDVVLRFNREVIERGSEAAYRELLAPTFVNHTAPLGLPKGPEGIHRMIEDVLRPALAELRVEIHDQTEEAGKVTTRKTIRGTHRGTLLGVAATGRAVGIDVIEIVRIENGQYVEHWSVTSLPSVVASLGAPAAG